LKSLIVALVIDDGGRGIEKGNSGEMSEHIT
jgi:hypothetical protein